MSDTPYEKTCSFCKEKIRMALNEEGKWKPFNLNNGPHDCRDRDREKPANNEAEAATNDKVPTIKELDTRLRKLESIILGENKK